jgi:hypothetical protein
LCAETREAMGEEKGDDSRDLDRRVIDMQRLSGEPQLWVECRHAD